MICLQLIHVPPTLKGMADTVELTKHSICSSMFHTPLQVGEPCDLANRMWESQVPKHKEPVCDPIDCQRNLVNQMLHKVQLTIMLPWLSPFSE